MEVLKIKDYALESSEENLITLNYTFFTKKGYLIHSSESKIKNELFKTFVSYPINDFGEIFWRGIKLDKSNIDMYRKLGLSVILKENNFTQYMEALEFIKVFALSNTIDEENLNFLKVFFSSFNFPLSKLNYQINKLNEYEKLILLLAKLIVKNTDILLIDNILDGIENKTKLFVIETLINFSLNMNKCLIIFTTLSEEIHDNLSNIYLF